MLQLVISSISGLHSFFCKLKLADRSSDCVKTALCGAVARVLGLQALDPEGQPQVGQVNSPFSGKVLPTLKSYQPMKLSSLRARANACSEGLR